MTRYRGASERNGTGPNTGLQPALDFDNMKAVPEYVMCPRGHASLKVAWMEKMHKFMLVCDVCKEHYGSMGTPKGTLTVVAINPPEASGRHT